MTYFDIRFGQLAVLSLLLVLSLLSISCDKNEKTMNNNTLLGEFSTPHHTVPFNEIKASDFEPAFEEAFKSGRKEIDEIVNNTDIPTFENTIAQLSNSGERLGIIASILFNLNSAETNDSIQQIAMNISPKLTAYSNEIKLNQKLFERIKNVYDNCDRSKLTQEEITILEDTYKGFTRSGANLSDADKAKYKSLTEELSTLTVKFGQNVLAETNKYKMHISDENKLAGLPDDVKEAAKAKAKENDMDGWVFDLTAPSYLAFMKYADDRELREELYEAYMSKSTNGDEYDNQDVVRKITRLRLEIAKLLGYNCYADYVLEDKMAKNKESVYDLLNELQTAYKPAAINDYKEVNAYASKNGLKDEVQAWDWSYYSEKLKEEMYSISDEETKPYFELEAVKKGVFGLATKLWGITFKENKDIQVYHPEVTAYEVFDKSGDFLAVFYTDFHPRKGKSGGAWMTDFVEQKKGRRPHISIVMNFTRETETKPALLTFYEVETFLHEFGHALHGMFSDVQYSDKAGTSVAHDFVELPSQIMENWAVEPEYLQSFAKHYETGESIPTELIEKIKKSSNYLAGYLCLRQLSFGYLDMAWHTLTNVPGDVDIEAFEKNAWKETQVIPSKAGAVMTTQFGHLFSGGYAAGYYGYKWAEVLDADAFELFKENGIFDPATAESFRKNILSKGGSLDEMGQYVKFRGKKPSTEALLKRNGLK